MSALHRNVIRHGKFAAERGNHRGVRHQAGRHIIKRGIRHARKFMEHNVARYVPGLFPVELHATKGWRNVPAWS